MCLFEDKTRNRKAKMQHSESLHAYLDSSCEEKSDLIRKNCNELYSIFPEGEGKKHIKGLFLKNNEGLFSGFFELFLHKLFIDMDCEVKPIQTKERENTPDFLITTSLGERFYLEAKVIMQKGEEESANERMQRVVYDTLNRKINSPDFFIKLKIRGHPRSAPSGTKLAGKLQQWIDGMNYDDVLETYNINKRNVPTYNYDDDGWKIEFSLIPKSIAARSKERISPLGMRVHEPRWEDTSERISKAIEEKASKYGKPKHPLIIALNMMSMIDTEDFIAALYGNEGLVLDKDSLSEGYLTRDGNGAYTRGPRYVNTRASGVMLFINLRLENFLNCPAMFAPHPAPDFPCPTFLRQFPTVSFNAGDITIEIGKSIKELIKIDSFTWNPG